MRRAGLLLRQWCTSWHYFDLPNGRSLADPSKRPIAPPRLPCGDYCFPVSASPAPVGCGSVGRFRSRLRQADLMAAEKRPRPSAGAGGALPGTGLSRPRTSRTRRSRFLRSGRLARPRPRIWARYCLRLHRPGGRAAGRPGQGG